MSEMVSLETSDNIRFAEYQGDQNNIFPSNNSGTINRLGKQNLKSLLNARMTLSEESVMINNTVKSLSQEIRVQIENQLHQLIP